jgi:23S rRNA (guanosine2251-2'-O)-methyltransferase
MSRLVREECDFIVKLPMKGHVTSLNASVAAGILIYNILSARK